MNEIQRISHRLEADRLKLQMGIAPGVDIDIHALRAMWRQLQVERQREALRRETERSVQPAA